LSSINSTNMTTTQPYSLRQLVMYFLKLGTTGFGGPVALVGFMHRDLVEQNNWISDEEYKEGMALAQLAPGPLAAQLAIYLGYVHFGVLGATLVGLAFVLPSFLMVLALGYAYQRFGGLTWIASVFYGISAGVIGIIAFGSYKLVNKSIGNDKVLWGLFIVSALATIITESENLLLFLGAGTLYWLIKCPPKFLKINSFIPFFLQVPIVSAENTLLWQIFLFFAKAGTFVFGSGLAIVPFLYAGVVKDYGWLNEQQFLDSVAVAMITPGPVVITVGFIGYLVAGLKGACIAALATFLPCYLLTILPAPYFKKYGKLPAIKAFVDGITASAIGAIAGSVVLLARKSLIDIPTSLIAIAVIAILWKYKKITEPYIILACAAIGFVLKQYVLG
jgi:chromate transporter